VKPNFLSVDTDTLFLYTYMLVDCSVQYIIIWRVKKKQAQFTLYNKEIS